MILSICIPTYNRAEQLKNNLTSICEQIHTDDVEIIVSDNASTDTTESVVRELQAHYPYIRYNRNKQNIGLDKNLLVSIENAHGQYCWYCSDDDRILRGTVAIILENLVRCKPLLMYLNFAGYLEHEPYDIVTQRNADKENIIYSDPEEMMKVHLLNHLTATIVDRASIRKYFPIVDDYEKAGFERGYSLAMTHYMILQQKGLLLFVGKICFAVRNMPLEKCSYNPLTILIDTAHHYQILRHKGLIKKETEEYVINLILRGFYKLMLPLKCFRCKAYSASREQEIINYCKKYAYFYPYLYPCIILPWWVLFLPYVTIRAVKGIFRKIFKLSPF